MAARILVVEDTPHTLRLITLLLQAHGHTVTPVSYGEDAIETCTRQPLDLIIMDIQLVGGIDGFQTLRKIRAIPGLDDVPVLAVTAFAMAGDREQALAAGFAGYITKPINPYTFASDIDGYLPLSRCGTPRGSTPPEGVEPEAPTAPIRVDCGRILVVDDRPTNIDVLRTILQTHGYLVTGAVSIDEALACAHMIRPDLVLSDIHGGGDSSLDLHRRFRDDPALADTPVVFVATTAPLDDLPTNVTIICGSMEPVRLVKRVQELIAAHQGRTD